MHSAGREVSGTLRRPELVAGALLVAVVAWRAWPVIEALVISGVLATAIWPWVSRLTGVRLVRWRMPRPAAVVLVFAAVFISLAALVIVSVTGLLPVLDRLVMEYPGPTRELARWLDAFRAPTVEEGARRVVEEATAAPIDAGGAALGAAGGALTTGLVLLFTFLLLISGDRVAGWVFMALPRERRADARGLALRIRERLSRWVLGWLAYGAISGAVVLAVVLALGVPGAPTYAVAGVILALVPGVGTALVYVPAFVVMLDSGWGALAIAAAAVAHHVLDMTVLAPRTLGGVLQLPSIVMIVAMLVGVALFGLWGALIAAPLTAAIQQVLRERVTDANGAPAGATSSDPVPVP